MKPREYELYVAKKFEEQGYKTTVTQYSNDGGIDVIAQKGNEKIAIQAKMYGNTRKVSKATIMQLYGAMTCQDCTKAILATDGELLEDAIETAKKLKIEIMHITPDVTTFVPKENGGNRPNNSKGKYLTFDEAWEKYIVPLKGRTLENTQGSNTIIEVNWGGIQRKTSTGKIGKIEIEGFRLAYEELIKNGNVSREFINQQVDKRCSSGIVLVLSQIPYVEITRKPIILKLKKWEMQ